MELDAPFGLGTCPQSRAVYAVDLMLSWDKTEAGQPTMVPKILEFNFNPDTNRACKFHPDFYNHLFTALYLENVDISSLPMIPL